MTEVDYCLDTLYKSNSSFKAAFWFLKKEQAEALAAIYSFAHRIDSCIDDISEPEVAAKQLDFWKNELESIFSKEKSPSHPITKSIALFHQDHPWPEAPFYQLIDGMLFDLHGGQINNISALNNYCYKVASTIGELIFHVIEPKRTDIKELSYQCGLFMQKINILRDIGEDLRKGRCYIPSDFLEKNQIKNNKLDYSSSDIVKISHYLSEQILTHAQKINQLLSTDRISNFIYMILLTYEIIFKEVLRNQDKILTHKIRLGGMSKLSIIGRLICHKFLKRPLLAQVSAA